MSLPNNVAIIMDGNGRWAKARGHNRTFGHIKGARVAKKIITEAAHLGRSSLTLYAFGSENWFRPKTEVAFLMRLFTRYLEREVQNLVKQNIRFEVIGELTKLPVEVLKLVDMACERTKNCTGLRLIFAISYGSRQEITSAVQEIAEKVKSGKLSVANIDEGMIASHLQTQVTADPDLIIRTSGEQRLSNFLLWQAAYSEIYFCDVLWPDFTIADFQHALVDFSQRQRRFGTVELNEQSNLY